MATKQEVLDAIAQERQEVLNKLAALDVMIQSLKDQITNGQAATPADLDEIVSAVHDIFVPTP